MLVRIQIRPQPPPLPRNQTKVARRSALTHTACALKGLVRTRLKGVPVSRDTNCVWDTAGNRVEFVRGGAFKVESPPRIFYVGLLLLRRAAHRSGTHLAQGRRALSLLHTA